MQYYKPHYFNIYCFPIKLLVLLLLSFLFVSCNINDAQQLLIVENKIKAPETAININTASISDLEKLPNIGATLAQKIVEHREKYGKFRKPEHLILVPGISDKRFRQLQNLIKTE